MAFVVDVAGTETLGALLGMVYVQLAGGARAGDGLSERFVEDISDYTNPWGIAEFAIGSRVSNLGGYL